MRKFTYAILPTLAVAAIALSVPAAAQSTGQTAGETQAERAGQAAGAQDQGVESGRMTAPLPDESLAEERRNAIGTDPAPVQQGGAGEEDAAEAATPAGALPDETLAEERTGAIGEDPDAVVQGGAGDLRGAGEDAADTTGATAAMGTTSATGSEDTSGGTATLEDRPLGTGEDIAGKDVAELHAAQVVRKEAKLASGEEVIGTVDDVTLADDGATPEEVIIATIGEDIRKVAVPVDKAKIGEDGEVVMIDMEKEEFAGLPTHEGDTASGDMDTAKED